MDDELKRALLGYAIKVEQAGRALGIGRSAAYAAVRRGDLPAVRIGGALRVPTAPLRKMLGLEQEAA